MCIRDSFGINPAGHHFVSVLLHALNAVLLFLLLARLTGRMGASFFVAALFAVHPLNVESVVWISERKNVLSTTFFLLTLGAYGWYALKPGWRRYLVVVLFFALGLASKSMLVTLPFVLLPVSYTHLSTSVSKSPMPAQSASSRRGHSTRPGRISLNRLATVNRRNQAIARIDSRLGTPEEKVGAIR